MRLAKIFLGIACVAFVFFILVVFLDEMYETKNVSPVTIVNKSGKFWFGCTSMEHVKTMSELGRHPNMTGFLVMQTKGLMGDGCILIMPNDTVIYYGDPLKEDFVKARLPGLPYKLIVPSRFIIAMQEEESKK